MIDSNDFLNNIQQESNQEIFKLGIISNLKVQFDDETTPSDKTYKTLNGYTKVNGDRVLLVKISGTYIILGKLI